MKKIICLTLLMLFTINVVAPVASAQRDRRFKVEGGPETASTQADQANPRFKINNAQGASPNTNQSMKVQSISISDVTDPFKKAAEGLADIAKDAAEGVLKVGKDIFEAGANLFDGPGALPGIFVAGAHLLIGIPGIPGGLIPALALGAGVSVGINALIKHRSMTARERQYVERVFGTNLPANDRIVLTNLVGKDGRPFTWPNGVGQILVNIGDLYDDPLNRKRSGDTVNGQTFIHEMTHVWQLHNSKNLLGTMGQGLFNQLKHEFVENVYAYNCDAKKDWNSYNLEQQASIVDDLYAYLSDGRQYAGKDLGCLSQFLVNNIRGYQAVHSNGNRIATVSRIPNSMETFWIASNGSVQAAYWYEGSTWKRFELAPAGSASPRGGITAISRIPNSMEVFWIGANGSVQDAYWYEGSTWKRFELAPAGSASVTGKIAAISRFMKTMEIFWIGQDGSIQDAFWYEGGKWTRYTLAPAGSASVTGGITALHRIPNSMEIFWIGQDGSVQDAYFYDRGQFRRFTLAPAGSASLTGSIAALSRNPNAMEVFWVGANGSVQDAYWYDVTGWKRFELAPAGSASPSGSIAAVTRVRGSMEVFWAGQNGSVQDAYFYDGKGWNRFELAPANRASLLGGITAVSRAPYTMEVFYISDYGAVHDSYFYDGANWKAFKLAEGSIEDAIAVPIYKGRDQIEVSRPVSSGTRPFGKIKVDDKVRTRTDVTPGSTVELNPQPLPPKTTSDATRKPGTLRLRKKPVLIPDPR